MKPIQPTRKSVRLSAKTEAFADLIRQVKGSHRKARHPRKNSPESVRMRGTRLSRKDSAAPANSSGIIRSDVRKGSTKVQTGLTRKHNSEEKVTDRKGRSDRSHSTSPRGHSADGDSTADASDITQKIFTTARSDLSAAVSESLREHRSLLLSTCDALNVRIIDSGLQISLEGDWEMLCRAREKISQLLENSHRGKEVADSETPTSGHLTTNEGLDAPDEGLDAPVSTAERQMSDCEEERNTHCDPALNEDSTAESEVPRGTPEVTDVRSMCGRCGVECAGKSEYKAHFKTHLSEARKRPPEPVGELLERPKLSTSCYRAVMDASHFLWFQCRACPMVGSRRHRMAEHFRVSHVQDGGIPFKIVERESVNGQSKKAGDGLLIDEGSLSPTDTLEKAEQATHSSKGTSIVDKSSVSRVQQKHPEKATEVCSKCGYRTSAEGLRTHMRTNHTKYLYSCSSCNKTFTTLFSLRKHYKTHSKSRETTAQSANKKEFQCAKCGKTFKRKVDLVHHVHLGKSCSDRQTDSKEYNPPYKSGFYLCQVCGYKAVQRVHVVQHYARKHAPKEFACDQCSQEFAYSRELEKHQAVSHASEKLHKCHVCSKSFASAKYLTAHLLRHYKVNKHFCPVCGKGFLERYRLAMHLETHKDGEERQKPYHCTICDKAFSSDAYRKDHENIHSGEEPYTCNICGKTMKAKSSIWKHMQYHNEDKPHTCPHQPCTKRFRFKAALAAHMIIHTKEGKHRCERCNKVYTQRQSLLRHICRNNQQPLADNSSQDTVEEPLAGASVHTEEAAAEEQATDAQNPQHQEIYLCSECNKMFYSWSAVEEHMLWHTVSVVDEADSTHASGQGTLQGSNLQIQISSELKGATPQASSSTLGAAQVQLQVLDMATTGQEPQEGPKNSLVTLLDGAAQGLSGEDPGAEVYSLLSAPSTGGARNEATGGNEHVDISVGLS